MALVGLLSLVIFITILSYATPDGRPDAPAAGMKTVTVIGHVQPDTDSVVAALSMSAFLNLRRARDAGTTSGGEQPEPEQQPPQQQQWRDDEGEAAAVSYVAAVAGPLNLETQFLFGDAQLPGCPPPPPLLPDASGCQGLFLVDHNEASQWVPGARVDQIVGFVDHHKLCFTSSAPIEVHSRPWGSTNTLVAELFRLEGLPLPPHLKPLMLAAILSDTLGLTGPTTTAVDRRVAGALAADVPGLDPANLWARMLAARARLAARPAAEVVGGDLKLYELPGGGGSGSSGVTVKLGVGQVELSELADVEHRAAELAAEMARLQRERGLDTVLLVITDVDEPQPGSKLLVVSAQPDRVARAFGATWERVGSITDSGTDETAGSCTRDTAAAATCMGTVSPGAAVDMAAAPPQSLWRLSAFLPGIVSRKKNVMPALAQEFK